MSDRVLTGGLPGEAVALAPNGLMDEATSPATEVRIPDAVVEELAQGILADLTLAAKVGAHPDVVRRLLTRQAVQARLADPVFFAVLLCGQAWLAQAPQHQTLLGDGADRIVVVAGRGWGKSLVVSLKAVTQYLFRTPRVEVIIASASQRQSMQLFDYLERHILGNPLLAPFVARHTRTQIRLRPPWGGKVEALPCSPNKLRGKHPDVLIVDEASVVPAEMLSSELLLMLTKPRAKLLLLGTPFGTDHPFRRAFGQASYRVYHFPSYTSPLVSRAMLDEWRQLMTEEEWQREVEAQWVELQSSYFPLALLRECFFDPQLRLDLDLEALSEQNQELGATQPCYAGLDLAKHRDYSVLSVVYGHGEALKHVFLHRFPQGTDYVDVVAYVTRANQVFRFQQLVVDQTGVGEPLVEELQRQLACVEGVVLTAARKAELLARLKLRMEQRRLALVNYRPLIAELNEQQYTYQRETAGAHLRFSHPVGHHDDMLWSLALAVEAAQAGEAVVIPL